MQRFYRREAQNRDNGVGCTASKNKKATSYWKRGGDLAGCHGRPRRGGPNPKKEKGDDSAPNSELKRRKEADDRRDGKERAGDRILGGEHNACNRLRVLGGF